MKIVLQYRLDLIFLKLLLLIGSRYYHLESKSTILNMYYYKFIVKFDQLKSNIFAQLNLPETFRQLLIGIILSAMIHSSVTVTIHLLQ